MLYRKRGYSRKRRRIIGISMALKNPKSVRISNSIRRRKRRRTSITSILVEGGTGHMTLI